MQYKQLIYDRINEILNSYINLGILQEDLTSYLTRNKKNLNNVINRIYSPFNSIDEITKTDIINALNDIIRDKIAKIKD